MDATCNDPAGASIPRTRKHSLRKRSGRSRRDFHFSFAYGLQMFDDDPAPRLPTTSSERRTLAMFASVLVALLLTDIATDFTRVKLSVLFALLAWIPLLVLHELGHAGAARLVGWRVSEIVIGFGRELYRFRIGSTRIRLLAAPVEGYVVPSPTDTRYARLKSAWIYAAGPGIELTYVGACWLWFGAELVTPSAHLGLLAVQSSCMAAVLGAGFNLVPYSSANSASDGLGIIYSLTTSDESFRIQLASPFIREARRELLRENPAKARQWAEQGLLQYPEDWQLRATRAVCIAAGGEPTAAMQQLEELGNLDEKPGSVRAELLLDAAWAVLFAEAAPLMLEAQRACERALQLFPDHVRGSLLLGRILLARQRSEKAVEHLLAGYRLTRDRDYEAQFVVYLAIACRAAGQEDYARRFTAAAQRQTLPPSLAFRLRNEKSSIPR